MTARALTPKDVAQMWQVSDRTVQKLCETGELRAFRVGRMFRIRPEDVETFECSTSPSDGLRDGSSSHGERAAHGAAIALMHAPAKRPKRKP